MYHSNIKKISLSKLTEIWNPFEYSIWIDMKSPITKKEVSEAIKNKKFISPDVPKNMYLDFWDKSTREEHIARIAWLVENYNEEYHLEIDFGVPSMGCYFCFMDGNHRLCAAIYLNKEYVLVNCSGGESEIEKFVY